MLGHMCTSGWIKLVHGLYRIGEELVEQNNTRVITNLNCKYPANLIIGTG